MATSRSAHKRIILVFYSLFVTILSVCFSSRTASQSIRPTFEPFQTSHNLEFSVTSDRPVSVVISWGTYLDTKNPPSQDSHICTNTHNTEEQPLPFQASCTTSPYTEVVNIVATWVSAASPRPHLRCTIKKDNKIVTESDSEPTTEDNGPYIPVNVACTHRLQYRLS